MKNNAAKHSPGRSPFYDNGNFINYSAGYIADTEFMTKIHHETFLAIQLIPARHRSACENLAAEVLASGIKSLLYYQQFPTVKGQRLYQEERAWLVSEDSTSPFSFLRLTEYFHLDSEKLRRTVLAVPAGTITPIAKDAT